MPNMVTGWVGDLLIGVHNASTPTDAEWRTYMELAMRQKRAVDAGSTAQKQLIVTSGGGPSLEQRRIAHAQIADASFPVAVVSSSGFVRFVVTVFVAMGTNTKCRSFAPDELLGALQFLGVDADREAIERSVESLTAALAAGESRRPKRFWERRRAGVVRAR